PPWPGTTGRDGFLPLLPAGPTDTVGNSHPAGHSPLGTAGCLLWPALRGPVPSGPVPLGRAARLPPGGPLRLGPLAVGLRRRILIPDRVQRVLVHPRDVAPGLLSSLAHLLVTHRGVPPCGGCTHAAYGRMGHPGRTVGAARAESTH